MNKNKILKYFSHYLPLVGILFITAVSFQYYSYQKDFLLGISIAVSVAYVLWGIVHHIIHNELNRKVVFEYISISLLGLLLLLSVIFWM